MIANKIDVIEFARGQRLRFDANEILADVLPDAESSNQEFKPFPIEVIPEALRQFAVAASSSIQVDPTAVILPMLAVLGSAIGNSRVGRVKPGWTEPAVAWAAVVMPSGSSKSPAAAAALAPLHKAQHSASAQHGLETAEFVSRKAEWKELASDARRSAKEPEPPAEMRCLYTSDATVEAIAGRLDTNPKGLIFAVDELAGWFSSMNQYKRGGNDLQSWLSMHGAAQVKIDRKTGDRKTLFIPRAFVGVTGTIQPATLERLLSTDTHECGLAARFLFAYPPSRPRRFNDDIVSLAVARQYADVHTKLLSLGLPDAGPLEMPLTDEAKREFASYFDLIEEQKSGTCDTQSQAILGKAHGLAVRLALILQLSAWAADEPGAGDTAIDQKSMRSGVILASWFVAEAQRIFRLFATDPPTRRRMEWVEKIRNGGGTVRLRDWQRTRGLKTACEAKAELNTLLEFGAFHWDPIGPAGGRPSEVFALL